MFTTLPASDAARTPRARWLTTSLIVHGLIVGLAVLATRGALDATRAADPKEPMLLFFPRTAETSPERGAAPEPDALTEPAPELPVPGPMPSDIPPIDLARPRIDPRDLVGMMNERGLATPGEGSSGTITIPGAIYEATSAPAGFEPATLLSQPAPEYPAALLSAGLPGVVLLEFVIDTAGTVEPRSIRAIESGHPAFEHAARAAVVSATFRPARLRGAPVRQITRQRVRFVPRQR